MSSAITPPARKENAILDKTNLCPIMAPMAEKSFISPAPSIFNENKGMRHIIGISMPMATVCKLLIPLIHKFIAAPISINGSVIVFLTLYAFKSSNRASTNSNSNKTISTNTI